MSEIESTKIIRDLPEELIEYAKKKLKEKVWRAESPVGMHNGCPYFVFGDHETGYLVLTDESKTNIIYFVRFQKVKLVGVRFGRQILVWVDKDHLATGGFVRKIFHEWLLPKYKCLVSDSQQTQAGYNFWRNALDQAFRDGRFVYLVDRRSAPNRLVRLPTIKDVVDKKQFIWGLSQGHMRTGIAISMIPLLKSDPESSLPK